MQDFWRGRKYKKNRNNLETFYGIRVNSDSKGYDGNNNNH